MKLPEQAFIIIITKDTKTRNLKNHFFLFLPFMPLNNKECTNLEFKYLRHLGMFLFTFICKQMFRNTVTRMRESNRLKCWPSHT